MTTKITVILEDDPDGGPDRWDGPVRDRRHWLRDRPVQRAAA